MPLKLNLNQIIPFGNQLSSESSRSLESLQNEVLACDRLAPVLSGVFALELALVIVSDDVGVQQTSPNKLK